VFAQVALTLKPGGLFVLHEYVGASQFQFPARQRQVIQACYDLLPGRYRQPVEAALDQASILPAGRDWRWLAKRVVDKLRDRDLVAAVSRRLRQAYAVRRGVRPVRASPNLPTVRSLQALDPSEAIRSAEIVPLLESYFEIVELKALGGSILQFLLVDIAGNFEDEAGGQLLDMLFAVEDALMASGDLATDFAFIVAVPLPDLELDTGAGGRDR
jgi:hypothetical protein